MNQKFIYFYFNQRINYIFIKIINNNLPQFWFQLNKINYNKYIIFLKTLRLNIINQNFKSKLKVKYYFKSINKYIII